MIHYLLLHIKYETLRIMEFIHSNISSFYCACVRVNVCVCVCVEAWCRVMDSKKKEVLPILERAYGQGQGLKWYVNWRLFFM